ncbi:hypothetical protein FS837_001473 [Tulasnella sp. UAMH 9824]|nr:hypothetical protein FS837_001473 [Tulasnella sp. UAMH 9824]
MTISRPPRKSLPGGTPRRRRTSTRKPTYAERLVSIIQCIRVERRHNHSNPKYKAPGCNNKNVVHRRSILKEAKRRAEANRETFTVHDAKQFSRAEGDLAEAGVLQKVSNNGHYRLAHSVEQELDKTYKDLTTEEQSDPLVIGDIVRYATNQVDRKRSPSREPTASPSKRRRTSLAPRFATLEPEYPIPPPSTRGASQHPPSSQARSMPPPRQSLGPFKRKTRNSTGGRIETLFEGSLSPPPVDGDDDEEESTHAQLEQARSNITRLNAEVERYKALLNGRQGPDQAHPTDSGEQSLDSIVPDSEENRTVMASGNSTTAHAPPRSTIPYQSERQHPNRDLEELEVPFESNDRPAPTSTHSSPVRPSVSAHGSFVIDPSQSSSASRRPLGRAGSNRGMAVHPTPPHTSDEEEEEEEEGGDQEMNDSLFVGDAGASFDGGEDSYKMELSKHLAKEEELRKAVEELEVAAREKDVEVKELQIRVERLHAEKDSATAEHASSLQERRDRIAGLEAELARKADELSHAEDKYHGEILALEVANEDMTSRMEALEAEKHQAQRDALAALAEVDGKAAEVLELQGKLNVAEEAAQRAEERVDQLEEDLKDQVDLLTEATAGVLELRSGMEALGTTNTELASRLAAMEADKAQAALTASNILRLRDEEIVTLQADLAATRLELATAHASLATRDAELAAAQQQNVDLQRTAEETQSRLEEALRSFQTVSAVNAGHARDLATATTSVDELTQKVQQLETRLDMAAMEAARLDTDLATSKLQVGSLGEQLDARGLELDATKAQLDETRKSKEINEALLNARVAELESKLSASANAHMELAESIRSYQDQLAKSHEAQNTLHTSLAHSRAKIDQLQASVGERSKELEDLFDQTAALIEDKVALESSLAHASSAIKNLERQVSKADRNVVRLSNSNHRLNLEKDSAVRDAEEVKRQKDLVEGKVQTVLGRYAELKEKIAVVQGFMGQAVDAVKDVEMAIDSPIA